MKSLRRQLSLGLTLSLVGLLTLQWVVVTFAIDHLIKERDALHQARQHVAGRIKDGEPVPTECHGVADMNQRIIGSVIHVKLARAREHAAEGGSTCLNMRDLDLAVRVKDRKIVAGEILCLLEDQIVAVKDRHASILACGGA